jgi:hypothetical protein
MSLLKQIEVKRRNASDNPANIFATAILFGIRPYCHGGTPIEVAATMIAASKLN